VIPLGIAIMQFLIEYKDSFPLGVIHLVKVYLLIGEINFFDGSGKEK
jgi:hypothetical protein